MRKEFEIQIEMVSIWINTYILLLNVDNFEAHCFAVDNIQCLFRIKSI